MARFFKRLWFLITHEHEYVWYRNIYGDEINLVNGKRSEWQCRLCGKWKLMDSLNKETP